jgi:lauroyl/myristoyl acyltransferase
LNLPESDDQATQVCLDWIEEQIRAHPHGWLWLHDRWKVPPQAQDPE